MAIPLVAWMRRSCRDATSGVLPHTPTVVQPLLSLVCSHWKQNISGAAVEAAALAAAAARAYELTWSARVIIARGTSRLMGADDDDDDTHAASELRDRRLRAALPLWAAAAGLKSAERVAWRWSLFIVMCMCVCGCSECREDVPRRSRGPLLCDAGTNGVMLSLEYVAETVETSLT
jgi:hypothetical protein